MLRLFKIENGLIHEIKCPLEELGSHLIQADWIDAHEPDEDERALLQHMLCTELPEPDEVEEIETSARCFVDQAGIHVHSLFLAQSEGRHTTVSVACILQKNCLITIREGDLADFRLLRMRDGRAAERAGCRAPPASPRSRHASPRRAEPPR